MTVPEGVSEPPASGARLSLARRPGARSLLAATAGTVVCTLPAYLLGALVVLVRGDLGFSAGAHGTAIALYYAAAAVGSVGGGQLVEWAGVGRSLRAAAITSGGVCAAIAAFAHGWGSLVAILMVGGLASGVAQPAANAILAKGVSSRRMATAFGTKQAAVPTSGILSGLAVPVLGVTLGWRWAFLAAVPAAVAVALVIPARADARPKGKPRFQTADLRMFPLVAVTLAFGLGSAAAITLPAFLAEAAVSAGHTTALGGFMVAAGSATSVAVRLIVGWLADRRSGGHMRVVAVMLVGGAAGFVALSMAESAPMLFAGAVLAFGAGWGWPGLLLFALVRVNPLTPGVATGIAQGGATIGAVVGPIAFGWVVTHGSFGTAWLMAAGAAATAGVLLLGARTLVARDLARGADLSSPEPGRPRGAVESRTESGGGSRRTAR